MRTGAYAGGHFRGEPDGMEGREPPVCVCSVERSLPTDDGIPSPNYTGCPTAFRGPSLLFSPPPPPPHTHTHVDHGILVRPRQRGSSAGKYFADTHTKTRSLNSAKLVPLFFLLLPLLLWRRRRHAMFRGFAKFRLLIRAL